MPTKPKHKKKDKVPEPYFQDLVKVLFKFYHEHFNDTITFDNSQPRDFRLIVVAMRKRVNHAGLEWTKERAERMLRVFLEFAIQDEWLKNNFLPFNLNRQKDKIFFRIKQYQIQKLNKQ